MKKIFVYFIVICAISLISSLAWAITISFDPSDSSVKIGESINVDINISGLENTNLAGFDFNIAYDSNLLGFDSYVFGTHLGDNISTTYDFLADAWDMSFGNNLVELAWGFTDFDSQLDAFTLATLTFKGIGSGTSSLSISDLILSDDSCPALSLGYEDINSVSITVNDCEPVPEPATIFLLGFGLIGITGFMKKRHPSRQQ